MNAEDRKSVDLLSQSLLMVIEERVEESKGEVNDDEASTVAVSILEVARNVSLLTDEVREMVKMQREAMEMAKAMIEKFSERAS